MCFSKARQSCILRQWNGHLVLGYIFANCRNYITTPHHFQDYLSFFTNIFCLISLLPQICLHPPLLICTCPLYILLWFLPCQVPLSPLPPSSPPISVMECVLVVAFSFPSLSLPLSMGTLGLRQSCVAMATGCVAELCTPGIWSLSS